MRLGIDFDNTIVCYDALFHRVAREGGWIPETFPANKSEIRNHLRRLGHEEIWTEMQGRVYGHRLLEAAPFPGVLAFFLACRAARLPVFIISHKTRQPFLGEPCDLHAAALGWLKARGFLDPDQLGLPPDRVFFERTREDKLRRIAACGCTHFIDDLPEFLAEPDFPPGVERLLFDPAGLYAAETRFRRAPDWSSLARTLALPEAPPDEAQPFLEAQGVPPATPWEPLSGGANNRLWRLALPGRPLVLKSYFHSPSDPRDRFRAEKAFYEWAGRHAADRVPEPVAWDPSRRLGLFRHIEGRRLTPDDLDDALIDQAAAFVAELNRRRDDPRARALPRASEACLSVTEHLACVERRVERLQGIPEDSPLDTEVRRWVASDLLPAWQQERDRRRRWAASLPDAPLPPEAWCLSPSDFGFHNALLPADGRLRFFDFEYAGWDDPAKLIDDFFCQPEVPVAARHWDRWTSALDAALGWGGRLDDRARHLLPLYRIKWACIVLNEFVATDRERRAFARGADDLARRRQGQFAKARRLLAALNAPET